MSFLIIQFFPNLVGPAEMRDGYRSADNEAYGQGLCQFLVGDALLMAPHDVVFDASITS